MASRKEPMEEFLVEEPVDAEQEQERKAFGRKVLITFGAFLLIVTLVIVVTVVIIPLATNKGDDGAKPTPAPNPDVVMVLGAQIVTDSTGKVVPAIHAEIRAVAAAAFSQQQPGTDFLLQGGYNVGVRYLLSDNKVLDPANFTFAAFAEARSYPSEAEILRQYMIDNYNIPARSLLVEETSATTEENAKIAAAMMARNNFLTPSQPPYTFGVLSTTHHLNRAYPLFIQQFAMVPNTNLALLPLCAEDWAVLVPSAQNWYQFVLDVYPDDQAREMVAIMRARAAGNLNQSVCARYGPLATT